MIWRVCKFYIKREVASSEGLYAIPAPSSKCIISMTVKWGGNASKAWAKSTKVWANASKVRANDST